MLWFTPKKTETRLTHAVACAGCASKLRPSFLKQAVLNHAVETDPNLLVGYQFADDAGVYKISEDQALVQTVDFFTPILDDPTWYGRVAAANALSDVYAMGGKPLTALNILCYPEKLGATILEKILAGAREKLKEAGCTLVGGHSVQDDELKFGMAITGLMNPKRIFSNSSAKAGLKILLTKKLGTGVLTTAGKNMKKGEPADLPEVRESMARLNRTASEVALELNTATCTDVTGFGLLGHLSEVLRASHIGAQIQFDRVPRFPTVMEWIEKGFITRGDKTNREYVGEVLKTYSCSENELSLLLDPQTSGGLLVFIPQTEVDAFISRMKSRGEDAWLIGETFESQEPSIEVVK